MKRTHRKTGRRLKRVWREVRWLNKDGRRIRCRCNILNLKTTEMHFKMINCTCQCLELLRLKFSLDCNEWTFCKAETKNKHLLLFLCLSPPSPDPLSLLLRLMSSGSTLIIGFFFHCRYTSTEIHCCAILFHNDEQKVGSFFTRTTFISIHLQLAPSHPPKQQSVCQVQVYKQTNKIKINVIYNDY